MSEINATAQVRIAAFCQHNRVPVPKIIDKDGAPHPELLDFTDRHGITLDWVFGLTDKPPYSNGEKALDLYGLIRALQCIDDTNLVPRIADDARAAVLNMAERLAADLKENLWNGGGTIYTLPPGYTVERTNDRRVSDVLASIFGRKDAA
jgi:hypothetical protein